MKKEFVLRLLPLANGQGSSPDAQGLSVGTPVYLSPAPDDAKADGSVIVTLEPGGLRPVGRVDGDDNNRLYTRLTRGSIASALVQGEGPRGGVMLAIRVEDFGNAGMPVDSRQVLPSRPPRRTALISLATAPGSFQPADVNGWVRQIAARIDEAEDRGEDMAEFVADQLAEISAYEARLPPASRAQFRQWFAAEVDSLEDGYGSSKGWLSGKQQPDEDKPKKSRRWIWITVLVILALLLIFESRST